MKLSDYVTIVAISTITMVVVIAIIIVIWGQIDGYLANRKKKREERGNHIGDPHDVMKYSQKRVAYFNCDFETYGRTYWTLYSDPISEIDFDKNTLTYEIDNEGLTLSLRKITLGSFTEKAWSNIYDTCDPVEDKYLRIAGHAIFPIFMKDGCEYVDYTAISEQIPCWDEIKDLLYISFPKWKYKRRDFDTNTVREILAVYNSIFDPAPYRAAIPQYILLQDVKILCRIYYEYRFGIWA